MMRRTDEEETTRHDGGVVEVGIPRGRAGEEPFDREGLARTVNGGEE
ncbi:hypothetical protein [Halorubrum aethiopicum]|nr:hypothetical protein [Halorubrum aethiopicum]